MRAKRSLRSFKQRYNIVDVVSVSQIVAGKCNGGRHYFEVKFPGRENDMLSRRLDERLDARVRLVQ